MLYTVSMISWVHYLIFFAVAVAVTAALVPAVRRLAVRVGAVDEPGPRRVNKKPIPRMGGLAMFGGIAAAVLFEYLLELVHVWPGPLLTLAPDDFRMVGVVIGIAVIAVVGVVDDIYSLRPLVKFAGQILAACIIAFTGTLFAHFHMPGTPQIISLGFWAYPITIFYLVAFVNVINLIDGLDGLAAGITAISALTLFVMMTTMSNNLAALMAIVLAAVCIAFLFFNFNPASIFMGDSGSMLLGLMLGTISLLGVARFASITTTLVPIIIAFVPIIDTFGAIVRRLRGHKRIDEADSGHIHHRLLLRGYSQRKAVLLIYLWTAVLSIGTLVMWEVGGAAKYVSFIALVILSAIIVWRLGLFGPVRQRHGRGDVVYSNKGIDPDPDVPARHRRKNT